MTRHSDVFVGIASFGRRARMLEAAVESLLPQVDRIGVYLNNYPEIPSFLDLPRIVVEVSADHGDLRDNGKFFFLGKTGHRFYASADDDLVYPPDYIDVLKGCLGDAGPGSAIAVHGAVYPPRLLDMFTSRHLFHFSKSLQHVMPVHLVGTGTLFFDQAEWQLSFDEFGEPGMADVWFARSAKARGARLFVVNRNRDWLRPVEAAGVAMPTESPSPTLYAEAKVGRGRQVELGGADQPAAAGRRARRPRRRRDRLGGLDVGDRVELTGALLHRRDVEVIGVGGDDLLDQRRARRLAAVGRAVGLDDQRGDAGGHRCRLRGAAERRQVRGVTLTGAGVGLVLEVDPVVESSHVVAEVEAAGGAHAGEDARCLGRRTNGRSGDGRAVEHDRAG